MLSTRRYVCLLLLTFKGIATGFFAPARTSSKAKLLQVIESGSSDKDILSAVKATERLNPVLPFQSTIKSPLLSDRWLMVYTTSVSIAGKSRPSPFQTAYPPEQLIDVAGAKAENSEVVLGVRNAVEIELTPETSSRVGVRFTKFKVGPFAFDAPKSLTASLEVTYLDETLRISRGDRGNVFVLLRQVCVF